MKTYKKMAEEFLSSDHADVENLAILLQKVAEGKPPNVGNLLASFFVPSNPLPKQSTRFTRKGAAYTPQRILNWQRTVRDEAKLAVLGLEDYARGVKIENPYEGKVHIDYRFLREKNVAADWDNLAKPVSDGMNKVVYLDDKQIKSARVTVGHNKEAPGVWVEVSELE